MQSLLILGRQPELGLAEIESLYGDKAVRPVGSQAVIVDVDPCLLAFNRLGGSLKFCKVLTVLDSTDWPTIEKFLVEVSPGHSQTMPAGKMKLGLSQYDLQVAPKVLMSTGLKLKKAIQKTGRSVRVIPNLTASLNSAQVLHNQLTGPNGWELIFARDGTTTIVAQTVKVQAIAAYAKRDQGRPSRDSRVGMLPPKLAQIIINLAVGKLPEDKLESICDIPADQTIPPPDLKQIILDPFCGTGVILQEALMMGYQVYGSDFNQRMIDYSKANLDWLRQNFSVLGIAASLALADATSATWSQSFDCVASETYLGPAFTAKPSDEQLAKAASECNLIIKKFLQNIHQQLQPGQRLCIAIPAWQLRPKTFRHLPLIDQISEIGYNRVRFKHVRESELLYYRADQTVARELLVITRK